MEGNEGEMVEILIEDIRLTDPFTCLRLVDPVFAEGCDHISLCEERAHFQHKKEDALQKEKSRIEFLFKTHTKFDSSISMNPKIDLIRVRQYCPHCNRDVTDEYPVSATLVKDILEMTDENTKKVFYRDQHIYKTSMDALSMKDSIYKVVDHAIANKIRNTCKWYKRDKSILNPLRTNESTSSIFSISPYFLNQPKSIDRKSVSLPLQDSITDSKSPVTLNSVPANRLLEADIQYMDVLRSIVTLTSPVGSSANVSCTQNKSHKKESPFYRKEAMKKQTKRAIQSDHKTLSGLYIKRKKHIECGFLERDEGKKLALFWEETLKKYEQIFLQE